MNLVNKVLELCAYSDEQEWFEFKENWFDAEGIGEYISALSNASAFHFQPYAYFVWGVNDKTHEIVGTKFNQYCDYNKEPLQNFLARNLNPSINFVFKELEICKKRVVVLLIPAAEEIPTSFKEKRYIRIGSAKANLKNYPKREIQLFKILDGRVETIESQTAKYQDLTFNKLFGYYGSRGIVLKQDTFEKNLRLRNNFGEYNTMAQLLSDNSHMPIRVSIFKGKSKASPLISVREFGNNCLLYSLDNLIQYGDVLNLIQADEEYRNVERREIKLFDEDAYREAMVNAILHNYWAGGNEPMISVFSDRLEILSRGSLPPSQTLEGFYSGESIPVNEKLSEIFLQLHISEKSGRGVPIIVNAYGKEAITFKENSIVITIPFNRIDQEDDYLSTTRLQDSVLILNDRRKMIIDEIKKNPRVTKAELSKKLGISDTAIDKNIAYLRDNGYIQRIGKTKGGYWLVK